MLYSLILLTRFFINLSFSLFISFIFCRLINLNFSRRKKNNNILMDFSWSFFNIFYHELLRTLCEALFCFLWKSLYLNCSLWCNKQMLIHSNLTDYCFHCRKEKNFILKRQTHPVLSLLCPVHPLPVLAILPLPPPQDLVSIICVTLLPQ